MGAARKPSPKRQPSSMGRWDPRTVPQNKPCPTCSACRCGGGPRCTQLSRQCSRIHWGTHNRQSRAPPALLHNGHNSPWHPPSRARPVGTPERPWLYRFPPPVGEASAQEISFDSVARKLAWLRTDWQHSTIISSTTAEVGETSPFLLSSIESKTLPSPEKRDRRNVAMKADLPVQWRSWYSPHGLLASNASESWM